MSPQPPPNLSPSGEAAAGRDFRQQVDRVGNSLAESFTALLGSLTGRQKGPQALGEYLGITTVTASRLLRAVDLTDPVAVVQQIPGTVPLRRIIEAAAQRGAPEDRRATAERAVAAFEELIREHAGHRSGLSAMLTDWLPQGRREFEIRRRQAAYKAISELKGVSSELDLSTIVLHPSREEGRVDLLSIQGIFGLDRIRPDAVVHLGTMRRTNAHRVKEPLQESDGAPRGPLTLDGDPSVDGLHSVRLDQFCSASPAPLETRVIGEDVQYTLGQTGFGPRSTVDLVIAEVNPGELLDEDHLRGANPPYFFHIPAAPTRSMVFDVLVHEEVYPGLAGELIVFDTGHRGPASPHQTERDVDRMRVSETLEDLGASPARRRLSGFPGYGELLEHAFDKLGWDPTRFRGFRVQVSYPLHGTQTCILLR